MLGRSTASHASFLGRCCDPVHAVTKVVLRIPAVQHFQELQSGLNLRAHAAH